MKILVTGGAGYIGSILVPHLLSLGYDVTVFDNFMHGQFPFGGWCHSEHLHIANGDVRDYYAVKLHAVGADVIIPLAAIVGAPACERALNASTNTNIFAIEGMVSSLSDDQRIIIPITNSGYGIGEPGKECTEESPLNPISHYGKTKVEAERAALDHGNTVSLRLATVFGMSPRMRLDLLVNDFTWRAVHDKALVLFEADFKRNYIHVQDVARTFVHVLKQWDTTRNQVYNAGLSSANLSKRELCAVIKTHVPDFVWVESATGTDPDKRDYIVSNAKLEATGWQPAYTLDDGIRELIKGFAMMRKTAYGNI